MEVDMEPRAYKEKIMGYCDWVRNTLKASFPEFATAETECGWNDVDEYKLVWGVHF